MASVFIGGSRALSKLNTVIRQQLDILVRKKCRIFVGDANGADKAVQAYLHGVGYRDVTVYSVERCRNNLGAWKEVRLEAPSMRRDFTFFALKDMAMAKKADCGLMLWDGASKGTLNNAVNLLHQHKRVLLYFGPEKKFLKFDDLETFRLFLSESAPSFARFEGTLAESEYAETNSQISLTLR